jgi:hypothetical protein
LKQEEVIELLVSQIRTLKYKLHGKDSRLPKIKIKSLFDSPLLTSLSFRKNPTRKSINLNTLDPDKDSLPLSLRRYSSKKGGETFNTLHTEGLPLSFRRNSNSKATETAMTYSASLSPENKHQVTSRKPSGFHHDMGDNKPPTARDGNNNTLDLQRMKDVIKQKIDRIKKVCKFPCNSYHTEINLLINREKMSPKNGFNDFIHEKYASTTSLKLLKMKGIKPFSTKRHMKQLQSHTLSTEIQYTSCKTMPVGDSNLRNFDKRFGILSILRSKKEIGLK